MNNYILGDWTMDTKTCTRCKNIKPLTEYYTNKTKWYSICKVCSRHASLERMKNNPEYATKRRSREKAYRQYCKTLKKPDTGTQICTKCKEEKQLTQFHKDNGAASGRNAACKKCTLSRLKENYYRDVWGLPEHFVDNKLKTQNGKCQICNKTAKLLLDHNHKTYAIRDFLCTKCNTGIGYFFEDENILRSAIEYIAKHKTNPNPIKAHPKYQQLRDAKKKKF